MFNIQHTTYTWFSVKFIYFPWMIATVQPQSSTIVYHVRCEIIQKREKNIISVRRNRSHGNFLSFKIVNRVRLVLDGWKECPAQWFSVDFCLSPMHSQSKHLFNQMENGRRFLETPEKLDFFSCRSKGF